MTKQPRRRHRHLQSSSVFKRVISGVLSVSLGLSMANYGTIIQADDDPEPITIPQLTEITVEESTDVSSYLELDSADAGDAEILADFRGKLGGNPIIIEDIDDLRALQWMCNHNDDDDGNSVSGFENKNFQLDYNINLGGSGLVCTKYVNSEPVANGVEPAEDYTLEVSGAVTNAWTPIGGSDGSGTCNPFKGHFDGNGNTISGMVVYKDYVDGEIGEDESKKQVTGAGLFGVIDGGSVENLTIEDATVVCNSGASYTAAGGVVGLINGDDSYIRGCHTSAAVINLKWGPGDVAGGVIGYWAKDEGITLENCSSTGDVYSNGVAGGVCGAVNGEEFLQGSSYLDIVTVTQCSRPNPASRVAAIYQAGGILGGLYMNTGLVMDDCAVNGWVTATDEDFNYAQNLPVGALVPFFCSRGDVRITNCTATGAAAAQGGLLGGIAALNIENEGVLAETYPNITIESCNCESEEFNSGAIVGSICYCTGHMDVINCTATATNFFGCGLFGNAETSEENQAANVICDEGLTMYGCSAQGGYFASPALANAVWVQKGLVRIVNCSATGGVFKSNGLIKEIGTTGGEYCQGSSIRIENCGVTGSKLGGAALCGSLYTAWGEPEARFEGDVYIKNCTNAVPIEIESKREVGGLIDAADTGVHKINFINCQTTCDITSDASRVGGLIGGCNKVRFINCSSSGAKQGGTYEWDEYGWDEWDESEDEWVHHDYEWEHNACAGGLVGACSDFSAKKCETHGSITLNTSDTCVGLAGGLAGAIDKTNPDTGDVSICWSDTGITCDSEISGSRAGGLFGSIARSSTIHDCYGHGDITCTGSFIAGGLIGTVFGGTAFDETIDEDQTIEIAHCYFASSGSDMIFAIVAGGFKPLVTGKIFTLDIIDSYYDEDVALAGTVLYGELLDFDEIGGNTHGETTFNNVDDLSGGKHTSEMKTTIPLFNEDASHKWTYTEEDYPVFGQGPRIVTITEPGETIKEPEYIDVPGDTEYIEVPGDSPDPEIIYRDVPGETRIVYRDVPGETKTVYVEVPGEKEYIEVPGEKEIIYLDRDDPVGAAPTESATETSNPHWFLDHWICLLIIAFLVIGNIYVVWKYKVLKKGMGEKV